MPNFISFEGIDCSGKSTQIKLLIERLNRKGVDYKLIREPGGTGLSESIRNILLSKKNISIKPETESLLFLAARSSLIDEEIIDEVESKIIICDRFIDSTIAYQGYGRKLDIKFLEKLNSYAVKNIFPSLTFLIDISLDEYAIRLNSKTVDRMEDQGVDFMRRVRNGYLEISKKFSSRFCIINGSESEKLISKKIWEILINKGVVEN